MQKTAWISSLLVWPEDIIPNRQKFSFHDPISLNPLPSAPVVARQSSCKISWGRSINPRWTGNRQLTSQNSCRRTTRYWKHPESAATWKHVVTSPDRKSRIVTPVLPALQNRQVIRRNGNIYSSTYSVPGSSLHKLFNDRRIYSWATWHIDLILNGCTVEKKKRWEFPLL